MIINFKIIRRNFITCKMQINSFNYENFIKILKKVLSMIKNKIFLEKLKFLFLLLINKVLLKYLLKMH